MKALLIAFSVIALAVPALGQTVNDPALLVEMVSPISGLVEPTGMTFIGPNDILVNSKRGTVHRVTNGVVAPAPVLTLPVDSDSERGLLGITLHPDFAANNFVYLFHTAAATPEGAPIANRVSRFTWNGSTLQNEMIIKDLPVVGDGNHNGGIITFGPPNLPAADQKLFIIIGDLNRDNQTENYAGGAPPDNTAVVVRLNADGSIPSGADKGPFFDVAGADTSLQSMYAYGIRNSYGMDFDPVSNKLWDTENGPQSNDEINLIEPGFNSGWERVMGFTATPPETLVQFGGVGTYSNPEFTWAGVVAPTSIHFFRSAALGAQFENACVVGCNNNGKLYGFQLNEARSGFVLTGGLADTVLNPGDSDAPIVFGQGFPVVTDIRTGPDGFLYVLSLANGTIYRVRPVVTAVDGWELYQ